MAGSSYKMFISGKWVDASDGGRFGSVNPTTEEVWADVADATPSDVDATVEQADRAFVSGAWATMPASGRAQALRRLAEEIAKRAGVLAATETTDTGKLLRETRWQATNIARTYEYYAGLADKIEGSVPPFDHARHLSLVTRRPVGVVAAIVPWNSQLHLAAYKIAPALAAGNTVVIKASEHASCAMAEFFTAVEAAGFPPGVINLVTGGPACGAALVAHRKVRRVSFTGGIDTARHVIRATANNIAKLSLELGGKSPVIVYDDADIDSAVNGVVSGIFAATGQSCVAGSRLILHDRIYDVFLARLIDRASKIRIGDPTDADTEIGPLATPQQRDRIERLLAQSVAEGGRILAGGGRPENLAKGYFFQPTILECDSQIYPAVRQELFGPVLSVLRFRDDEEAVNLANDSEYAFAGGVFTSSLSRALKTAQAVRAGRFWVNTYRVASYMVPFGGLGESGYGREAGIQAVEDYTDTKSIIIDTSGDKIEDPFIMRG